MEESQQQQQPQTSSASSSTETAPAQAPAPAQEDSSLSSDRRGRKREAPSDAEVDGAAKKSGGEPGGRQQQTKKAKAPPPAGKRSRQNPINAEEPRYEVDEALGLRFVKPYYFVHECHAKERWVGRSIAEVFSKEFFAYSKDYYLRAIDRGRITINQARVSPETLVRREDWIQHKTHRHEPPVSAAPIEFLEISSRFVVIDKPASMPVHPCGRWRHNSVLHILSSVHGLKNLHPVHRLDRLTSGLLLLARDPQTARHVDQQIASSKVKKLYLCKVDGVFPGDPEGVVCDQPIAILNYKNSLMHCTPSGKPSKTVFHRLSTDGHSSSIVACRPEMGRKHQIRVHLQALGHPISNDPLYNAAYRQRLGISLDDDLDDILNSSSSSYATGSTTEESEESKESNSSSASSEEVVAKKPNGGEAVSASEEFDPLCQDCLQPRNDIPRQLGIWLHAWKYDGPDWNFETKKPSWAIIEEEVPPASTNPKAPEDGS